MDISRGSTQLILSFLFIWISFANAVLGRGQQEDEARFLHNSRQLTYEGKRAGEGYFSPDGDALIFQSEREPRNPFFQIYILDLETGDSHRVSPGQGKTTCAFFHPGSDKVLFGSTHLDLEVEKRQQEEIAFRAAGKERRYSWDYDVHMDIFSATRDGKNLERLTEAHGYDAEGSYSPDGEQIVFCSLRDAYTAELSQREQKLLEVDPAYFGEIYLMNADGSNQIRLTDWPGYDGGPFFSPDGERIVWRHFEENSAIADIYTMARDGSDIRRVTDFKSMSWAPYYHPSGEYIAFASNKLGFSNFELFMVDAQGSKEPVRVTFTDGFDGLPVFSPDGQKLSWTSNRTSSGKSQLFIADWDHQAALEALAAAPVRNSGQTAEAQTEKATAALPETGANGSENDASFSPQISSTDLESMVSYLASDKLAGRMSGTMGTKLAAEYSIARFKEVGIAPFGEDGTYLREFDFTAGVELKPDHNHLEVTLPEGARKYKADKDFRPLAFTTDETVEGEVVFAGYGLSVPGDMGEGADSYAGLDVEGKIVMILRFVPEEVDMARRQKLNRYAGLRYKAMVAREHGAKGVLVVSGPNSPKAGELVSLSYDRTAATSGIVAVSISGKVAKDMFAAAGKDLAQVQSELDLENPHFEGAFPLQGVRVRMQTGVKRIKKADNNVLSILRAENNPDGEAIVVGAHYDHIGYGEIGSLARKGEEGQIHNGADDNASGTAAVLELAAALAKLQQDKPDHFQRDVIFALWSGEELGIIGSSAFADDPPIAIDKIAAYLNLDMVGRLNENKLIVQGTGSSSVWRKILEKRNVAAGFNLIIQDDPYQPTDITAFYPKGVPVLSFFTGSHEDYNRPTDDPETLNYAGLERITRFVKTIITDLAQAETAPDYVKVERTRSQAGARESMRAYLGTIPDYATEGTEGVKLSGVSSGGPADKAGLQGGDIIVKFAGKEITNIYDYTYAIDAVKIGEPVEIVAKRDGEMKTFTIVPEARE